MASIQKDLAASNPGTDKIDDNDPDKFYCLSLVEEFKNLPSNKKS